MKRVLWFGFFDPGGMKARVPMAGLRALGVQVDECRVDPRSAGRFGKFIRLFKAAAPFRREPFDAVIVAFPGWDAVCLARLLFRAPIVFDASYSLLQSEVDGRGTTRRFSLRAAWLLIKDRFAAACADVILLDTEANAEEYARIAGVRREKIALVPIGADDVIFRPAEGARNDGPFTVLFHGSFIPLHGIETVVRAAERLESSGVKFRLVGKGQTEPAARGLAAELGVKNIEFVGRLPLESREGGSVAGEIRSADVVLGLFGKGRKAAIQVPFKVFEALASRKPVITADTPAVREQFACGRHLLCVPAGDDASLADAILKLRDDAGLRESVAREGYAVFKEKYAPREVARTLVAKLEAHPVFSRHSRERGKP